MGPPHASHSPLSKLINKKSSVAVRQGFYVIRAPQDGFVVRALKAGIGETIKQGEAVCTLQPTNPQMAVELYVRAMDVPLIQLNREVRIEFEGWPALQFSGWPSVAVGTFGKAGLRLLEATAIALILPLLMC